MTYTKFFVAAAISGFVATSAVAQNVNTDTTLDSSVADLEKEVRDDMSRTVPTFGNAGRTTGWTGSVTGRATLNTGNSDALNAGLGARVGYFDGLNGHRMALSYAYAKANSTVSKNELLLGYDYTRELNSNAYVFGKATLAFDEFDSYKTDAFVGGGVGYRVINDGKTQWSVQGGPGYRFTKDFNDVESRSAAVSLSSYYSQAINAGVTFTNDTDILHSKGNTSVTNEAGLSVAMSNNLALKTSLTSEWDSNPLNNGVNAFKAADNTLGVSVVYTFN